MVFKMTMKLRFYKLYKGDNIMNSCKNCRHLRENNECIELFKNITVFNGEWIQIRHPHKFKCESHVSED